MSLLIHFVDVSSEKIKRDGAHTSLSCLHSFSNFLHPCPHVPPIANLPVSHSSVLRYAGLELGAKGHGPEISTALIPRGITSSEFIGIDMHRYMWNYVENIGKYW